MTPKTHELLDGSRVTNSDLEWVRVSLLKMGRTVHELGRGGCGDEYVVHTAISKISDGLAGRDQDAGVWVYWMGGGMVVLRNTGGGDMRVDAVMQDVKACSELRELLAPLILPVSPKGTFHMLVKDGSGFRLQHIGHTDSELVRENYVPAACEILDHALGCLRSDDPCGRLVILDGPPGTGKSYIIRGMSNEVEATFVLVAPSLVGSLSGPELVPVLLGEKRKGAPVVLIMEDADYALVTRQRGELTQLSELLNIGDGLLGDLVDLRIVATTNAGRTDLDAAVQRPGRLCSHVQLGPLLPDHAALVYKRLTGGSWKQGGTTTSTLADVYRAARDDGWTHKGKPGQGGRYA